MQKFKGFKIDFLREPLEQLRLIQNQSSLIVEDLSELFEKINNQSQVDISQLNKNLDANYKRITRLGEPIDNLDAVRKEDLDRHLSDFNNPHQTGLSNLSDYNANFNNISNVFINGYYLYLSNFGNFFQIRNVYANGLNAMYNLNGELLFNSSPNANTIYYPYRASSCYLLNANYDSSITSSSSSIYYLKIQPYLLNGISYLPNVVSESSITNWHFRKVNNIIYVNDSLINSRPNYYARLNVGETMICKLSWNNSSVSRYIPIKINNSDMYFYTQETLHNNVVNWFILESSNTTSGYWQEQYWSYMASSPSWGQDTSKARCFFFSEKGYIWSDSTRNRLYIAGNRDGWAGSYYGYLNDLQCNFLTIRPTNAITRTIQISITRTL